MSTSDRKIETLAELLAGRLQASRDILVVGCGDGREAAILGAELGGRVVGVDIVDAFDPASRDTVELLVADAMDLPFPDASFDLVFSFHALEHIESPHTALVEMRRVLRTRGTVLIGTPNRQRVVGYVGSGAASRAEKLRWNVVDWRARLTGRFRNELGAHAGFARDELLGMVRPLFGDVEDLSSAYYRALYDRHERALGLIEFLGLSRFAYPALYVSGIATERAPAAHEEPASAGQPSVSSEDSRS